MRKLITGSLMLCSILSLRAQTFVKPAVKVKDTSFAVITDKGTFQACEAELKAYQEILGMEGLPTFIVYNEWNKPEDVKKVIVKLYKKDKLAMRLNLGSWRFFQKIILRNILLLFQKKEV
jgi:hypothetical protein